MAPTTAPLSLLALVAVHRVLAQAPELHPDPQCLQGRAYPPPTYPFCVDYRDWIESGDWSSVLPKDEYGNLNAWVDGNGLNDWQTIVFVDLDEPQTKVCGRPVAQMDYQTRCKPLILPINMGFLLCNHDTDECDEILGPGGTAAAASINTTTATNEVAVVKARTHKRDISTLATNYKRQDECSFSGGDTYKKYGETQRLTATLRCPQGRAESCALEESISRTVSSTNTFGASLEVGGDLFKAISASVSFSYEYSYTEETSQSTTYTVTLLPGIDAYLTWSPQLECVRGSFSGNCGEWSDEGEACIPLYLSGSNGAPRGEYNLVQVLAP